MSTGFGASAADDEEIPEEIKELLGEKFCTDCAATPCLCSLVKLELKLENIKKHEESQKSLKSLRLEKKKRKQLDR